MKVIAALLLSILIVLPVLADSVDEVRQAETGFAKAFADRDKAKFFTYVADDAVFMNPLATLRGKQQIIDRWSRFFDGVAEAPFSWGPERLEVTGGGKTGFSMGPIYTAKGEHAGYYSSIWQKQTDGSWKVVFDGPGNPPAPIAANDATFEEGNIATPDGVQLHYRKLTGGPVTIIAPLDFALFEPLQQFADIATVITYDMRGRGKSTRPQDVTKMTIQQDVQDLETVREHFKVDKFVPLGWSYLGKAVILYAAAHPEHVRRVIQLGPVANKVNRIVAPPEADFGASPEDVQKLQTMFGEGATTKTPKEFCVAQWNVLRYYLVGDPKKAVNFKPEEACALENEWPVNANAVLNSVMPTVDKAVLSADDIRKVAMPVLVIHGDKDRNAPYAGGRAWAAQLPDARLVTIHGGAHAMWIDDPVTTFGAIRHFLRGDWPLTSEKVTK